jgi:GTP cyclohydrolase I
MQHLPPSPPDSIEDYAQDEDALERPEDGTQAAVRQILLAIGEDPGRPGLQKTPARVARMYAEITAGYTVDPQALVNDALFEVDYTEMVVVKEIEFYSMCEHHMLPFFGRAAVAYVPNRRVIGLSKIPRIVEMFARRLQIQERMTTQIADFLQQTLDPHGIAVVVEAQHLCAMMRGVRRSEATMVTRAMRGQFEHDPILRAEFLAQIGK